MQRRRSSATFVAAGILLALAVQARAQQSGAADIAADIAKQPAKAQVASGSKLDPGLEAIARAWRRFGIRGAERESASRNVRLANLRLAAVIHLSAAERRPEVERALRRAWGEVVTVEGAAVYAQLPVPAIRRISRLSAVASVSLDEAIAPVTAPSKENVR